MKQLKGIALTGNQLQAIEDLRLRLAREFYVESLILYGSVARGEADEESDLDLLVVTANPLTRAERDRVTDMVFEVNLAHDTNLSTLAVDRCSWDAGDASVLLIREEILKEGIQL